MKMNFNKAEEATVSIFNFSKKCMLTAASILISTTLANANLVPEANLVEGDIQNLLNDSFEGTDGRISDAEKKKIEDEGKTSTTYGEMTVKGFMEIYARVKDLYPEILDDENVVFFDIGSGRGLVPIMFSLKTNFKKFIGVEIVEHRFKEAMQGLSKMKAKYPQYAAMADKVYFMNADVLKQDLRKVAQDQVPGLRDPRWFIWISSLCFPEFVMKGLVPLIEAQAPDGTVIFTSQALPVSDDSRIQLIEISQFEMTWTRDQGKKSRTHMYLVDKKGSDKIKKVKMKAEGEETFGVIMKHLEKPVMQPSANSVPQAAVAK